MDGINTKRWLIGGVGAGVLMLLLDMFANSLYSSAMNAALTEHSIVMQQNAGAFGQLALANVLVGLALVFFYALARARFGAGPKTAVIVALVFWTGSALVNLMQHNMLGLFPSSVLMTWGAVTLVQYLAGSLLGGWLYREA